MKSKNNKKRPKDHPKPSNSTQKVPLSAKKKRTKQQVKKKRQQRKTLFLKKQKRRKLKLLIVELLGAVIITSLFVSIVAFFFFTFAKVEGYSMVPVLRDRDIVYVSKNANIKTFDLVYIKHADTGEKDIRRVIGLPGQTIVYKNDQLQIDGVNKTEDFIFEEQQTAIQNGRLYTDDLSILSLTGKTKIPEGNYFVLGDNRPYSTDSRSYGLVDEKEIIGVVKGRLFPLHQMELF